MIMVALLCLVPVRVAQAQMVCGERQEIVRALESGHKERQAGVAISGSGGLVELFKSRGGRTWTLLLTIPGGPTCLLGSGENWEALEPDFDADLDPGEWVH